VELNHHQLGDIASGGFNMEQKNRPYSGMARTSSGSIISGYNQQNG
jgi:hypothetical protein